MLPRIAHQLRGRVEAHRLGVEQGRQEGGRLVALEPAGDVDQQRETGRVALRKTVLAETLDLLEDALGEIEVVAALQHAADHLLLEVMQAPLALPGGHRAAQLVGFAGREAGGHDGHLHHLLLEDRHAERALERRLDLVARILDRFQALAAPQVRMHHAALDRARAARSRLRSPGRRTCGGCSRGSMLICARDSIWNTPTVSARQIMS